MSDRFQEELAFLGIERSPAFVRASKGSGCAERFIRTLKENVLWAQTFETVEQLRQALLDFRETYNPTWLIQRHGFRPPTAIRAEVGSSTVSQGLRIREEPMGNIRRQAVFLSIALVFGWWALLGPARAAGGPQPHEGDVEVHDFTFQDGERLPLLKLHYTALGTPQRDASGKISNAVLLLHGTTGTGKSFLVPTLADHLFQPDQPLDAQRYYVVLPDGIGAGGSTKPSHGMRTRFPHYGYIDQVEAQHAMLKGLGIDHLKLVSGISQGGMQTWLWGERFPDMMDALAPVACMPIQISGRNLLWREIVVHAIRDDPEWHGGDYDPAHPPTQWTQIAAPLFMVMVSNPERLQDAGPDRAKTLAYYDQLVAQWRGRDANDTLYDVRSSADYDPAPETGRIKAPMLAINFADDQVSPAQFGVTRETVARLPSSQLTVLPGGYGHLGIFHAELWADQLGSFLDHLSGRETAVK